MAVFLSQLVHSAAPSPSSAFWALGCPCTPVLIQPAIWVVTLALWRRYLFQALFLFAQAHRSGVATGEYRVLAMPPILLWSLAADSRCLGWGTHRTLLLTSGGPT